ncbi:hypothetical protein G6F56_006392 [Rhizopus delemar]|nr:hypothetical protein G6F56_006392 [Rhizopus delemar]
MLSQNESNYSIYRPDYHRTPSTMKESLQVTSPIIVPSMSNYAYPYYKPTYPVIPIHRTLENATITYDTKVEYQKDLVKDVFFSPAVNEREMSPTPSISTDDDDDQGLGDDLFTLEEDLFDFGLDLIERNPEPVMSKRRWSDSVLKQNKRQKQDIGYYFSNEEESETDEEVESCWESTEEEEEEEEQEEQAIETTEEENCHLTQVKPRPTTYPTIYQKLTKARIHWCRYCGTTEGVNWRPGPWGKRTLCNKHGCDYKGYGFACKLPRLDLTGFVGESIDQRDRPVLQLFCAGCQCQDSWEGNVLVRCEGCPKAYHQKCCPGELSDALVASDQAWFCSESCCENSKGKRIIVELPRKRLPLMRVPSKLTEKRRLSSMKD